MEDEAAEFDKIMTILEVELPRFIDNKSTTEDDVLNFFKKYAIHPFIFIHILDEMRNARYLDRFSDSERFVEQINQMYNELIYEFQNREMEDQNRQDEIIRSARRSAIQKPKEIDYSAMTQRDIKSLIDDALDARDFDEVEKLSKFLENKEYLPTHVSLFEKWVNNNY